VGIYGFQIKDDDVGEGGALVCNDPVLYEQAVRFLTWARSDSVPRRIGGPAAVPTRARTST
jgi:dTDP-4-amino-4,6-dideoxygalactose transaminase